MEISEKDKLVYSSKSRLNKKNKKKNIDKLENKSVKEEKNLDIFYLIIIKVY